MIVWLALAAVAADPLLDDLGIPPDADVAVERGADRWTIQVGDRRFAVAPPATPADEQALRALVYSLWTDLDLLPLARLPTPPTLPPPLPVSPEVAPRPRPAPLAEPVVEPAQPPLVVLVPIPAPAPPPPPAAAPVEVAPLPPEPSVRVIAGLDLLVRDKIWPAAGGWVGVLSGVRAGVGGRAGGRLPRTTVWGIDTRLSEVYGDLLLWTRPVRAVQLVVGLGASGRWYTHDREAVAAHALPRASASASFPVQVGPLELGIGGGVELDLLATRIGYPDESSLLSPIAGKMEITFSAEPVRRIPTSH